MPSVDIMKRNPIKGYCAYCGVDVIRYGKLKKYSCDKCKMLMARWSLKELRERKKKVREARMDICPCCKQRLKIRI